MNAIRLVSWIHFLWGLSMVLIGIIPRPFGQLEAFLLMGDYYRLPVPIIGSAFVASGFISILTLSNLSRLMLVSHHLVPSMLMPQQLLLTVGALFSLYQLMQGFDARIWYAGIVQGVFCYFHAVSVYELYKLSLINKKIKDATND